MAQIIAIIPGLKFQNARAGERGPEIHDIKVHDNIA